jgi:hypothetical protein
MEHINFFINKLRETNRFIKSSENLKINYRWERAKEFGGYVGLSTPFVLKMFTLYGENKVLNLRGWLKDIPHDRSLEGLLVWKLKDGT